MSGIRMSYDKDTSQLLKVLSSLRPRSGVVTPFLGSVSTFIEGHWSKFREIWFLFSISWVTDSL